MRARRRGARRGGRRDGAVVLKVFYDLDTGVTLDRLRAGAPVEWLGPRGPYDFDLVLSFTGGRTLGALCQGFHFEDPRLDAGVRWLRELGVKRLRTGLSWADSYRPGWEAWFDRQMAALAPFDVTVTFCFTPEHRGVKALHTSPPQRPEEFAEFCARMVRRYA